LGIGRCIVEGDAMVPAKAAYLYRRKIIGGGDGWVIAGVPTPRPRVRRRFSGGGRRHERGTIDEKANGTTRDNVPFTRKPVG